MILKQDTDIFGPEWTISTFFRSLSGDNLQMEASIGRCEAVKYRQEKFVLILKRPGVARAVLLRDLLVLK